MTGNRYMVSVTGNLNNKVKMKAFHDIDEALKYAMMQPEMLTSIHPVIVDHINKTNHKILQTNDMSLIF
jgi:hypothetical protein